METQPVYTPEIFLRITVNDKSSQCPLSNKFGADSNMWESLLIRAYELNLNVVGVSFHVGSGCTRVHSFTEALNDTARLFELSSQLEYRQKWKTRKVKQGENALSMNGFHSMNVINIGGGFPGDASNQFFPAMVDEINEFMNGDWCKQWVYYRQTAYSKEYKLSFIAEPGRFFAHQSTTLITSVCGIKESRDDSQGVSMNYYLNDGVYGSFNNLVYDHAILSPPLCQQEYLSLIRKYDNNMYEKLFESVLGNLKYHDNRKQKHSKKFSRFFGPTCDGFDVIIERDFPLLVEGEKLFWLDMGAYTQAAASKFNGFSSPTKIYIHSSTQI